MGHFSREVIDALSRRAAPEQVPFLSNLEYTSLFIRICPRLASLLDSIQLRTMLMILLSYG